MDSLSPSSFFSSACGTSVGTASPCLPRAPSALISVSTSLISSFDGVALHVVGLLVELSAQLTRAVA